MALGSVTSSLAQPRERPELSGECVAGLTMTPPGWAPRPGASRLRRASPGTPLSLRGAGSGLQRECYLTAILTILGFNFHKAHKLQKLYLFVNVRQIRGKLSPV